MKRDYGWMSGTPREAETDDELIDAFAAFLKDHVGGDKDWREVAVGSLDFIDKFAADKGFVEPPEKPFLVTRLEDLIGDGGRYVHLYSDGSTIDSEGTYSPPDPHYIRLAKDFIIKDRDEQAH